MEFSYVSIVGPLIFTTLRWDLALAIKIQSPIILSPIFSLLQIYPTHICTKIQSILYFL